MEIKGSIFHLGEIEKVNDKFQKRVVVISVQDGQYEQKIPIEFTQAKCELLNSFRVGDTVSVAINIQGSEYKGKFYPRIQGWKITNEIPG
jgi:ribosomal protein L21E